MSKRPPEKGKALVPGNGGDSKLPALPSTNFLINFRALTAALDDQVKLYNELCVLWRGRNKPVDLSYEGDDVDAARELWTSVRESAEQCLVNMNALWAMRAPDQDMDSPSAEWLAWRIGEMTKAGIKMSADEMIYMADRLEGENIHGMAWESIFCELEDTRSKSLTISEMLKFLKETKHISDWQQRLIATDLGRTQSIGEKTIVDRGTIQIMGEDTVFAFEFKNAVFKEATVEYLDGHNYVDLAAEVRENEDADTWRIAIEAIAKGEGLSELVAKMEMQNDYSPNSEFIAKLKAGYRPDLDDPWQQARQILTSNKRVTLEWDMLVKNAQRRLNQDKAFACGCGAGYDEQQNRCKICGSFSHIVSHAKWEQLIEQDQAELQHQVKLESALSHKQKLIEKFVEQYSDKPNEKSPITDRQWVTKHIDLEKRLLSGDYIEILHCYQQNAHTNWHKLRGSAVEDKIYLEWLVDDLIPKNALTPNSHLGSNFVMICIYEQVERTRRLATVKNERGLNGYPTETYHELELKTLVPFKYEVTEIVDDIEDCDPWHMPYEQLLTAFTEDDRKAYDQLLVDDPTLDQKAQLVELHVKLYGAGLPPSSMIHNLRHLVSKRIKAEDYDYIITKAEQREQYERQREQREEEDWEEIYLTAQTEDSIYNPEAIAQIESDALQAEKERAATKKKQAERDRFQLWLRSLDLGDYIADAFYDHDIDEMLLPRLTDANLKDIGVASLGHRIKLLDAIAARNKQTEMNAPFDEMYDANGQLKS